MRIIRATLLEFCFLELFFSHTRTEIADYFYETHFVLIYLIFYNNATLSKSSHLCSPATTLINRIGCVSSTNKNERVKVRQDMTLVLQRQNRNLSVVSVVCVCV